MRDLRKDIFDDIIYGAILVLSMVVYIWMICGAVFATGYDTDVEIPVLETVVETEPVETTVPTEAPTEPEIPTEAPTEPEKVYYDVPLHENLQDYIFRICEERGIDPAIIIAMIDRESDFRGNLVGDNGHAFGLMQVQPQWHQERMDKLGVTDLLEPYQNVLTGIDYLDELLNYAGKERTIEWALMAYNGGPSYAIQKSSEGVVTEYVTDVLNKIDILRGE